jgi:pimeloyl-ACP methyl ester carboxylesterase
VTYDDLHIDVDGPVDAPPVLLLHGWGSHARNMAPVADGLSDRYRVHNIDLPGHGTSPPPPEPWGVPEHADLLRSYIAAEIGQPVTVFGHSNGGRIGLFMAATDPYAEDIARLVLVSPSGITPERSWSTRAKAALAKTLKAPVTALPSPLREPAEDWLRHTVLWRALGSSDYNRASGVMRETFVQTVTHTLDGPVHRIDIPALLFWGTQDTAVTRPQIDALEEAMSDCGVVELEGAGHYGYLDEPQTVMSATRYFLENTPADPSATAEPASAG